VTVTATVTLPAQPTTGNTTYKVLGGNGWSAPHAVYYSLIQLAGDAGGGTNQTTIVFDQRFMNIVSFCEMQLSGAGVVASTECEFQLITGVPPGAQFRARAFGNALFLTATGFDENLMTWNPPLLVDVEQILSTVENVDSSTQSFRAVIYCFQKRALEVVPLNIILAALPSVQYLNVNT